MPGRRSPCCRRKSAGSAAADPSRPGMSKRTGSAPVASSSAPKPYVFPFSRRTCLCRASSDALARSTPGRCAARYRTLPAAAGSSHPSPYPRGNPSTDSADRGRESSALSIVSGPSYPRRRSMSAAASPAPPPPTMTTESGRPRRGRRPRRLPCGRDFSPDVDHLADSLDTPAGDGIQGRATHAPHQFAG